MSALAADKSPVRDGSHWLKLVARDAVRHRTTVMVIAIQQEPLSRVKVLPAMNSIRGTIKGM